jgi:hypothetical protein
MTAAVTTTSSLQPATSSFTFRDCARAAAFEVSHPAMSAIGCDPSERISTSLFALFGQSGAEATFDECLSYKGVLIYWEFAG